jgi:hypothetical protein
LANPLMSSAVAYCSCSRVESLCRHPSSPCSPAHCCRSSRGLVSAATDFSTALKPASPRLFRATSSLNMSSRCSESCADTLRLPAVLQSRIALGKRDPGCKTRAKQSQRGCSWRRKACGRACSQLKLQ